MSKITGETASKVKTIARRPYERLNAWLPAGSGNFERTSINGNYRSTCNTVKLRVSCKNDPNTRHAKYWHCNKLDCSSCFITAASKITALTVASWS